MRRLARRSVAVCFTPRIVLLCLAGSVLLVFGPGTALTQFPGGGGGSGDRGASRGMGGFDMGMFFGRIAGGRSSIAIADIPASPFDPQARESAQAWAQKNGITNGQLTREQFTQYIQGRMSER